LAQLFQPVLDLFEYQVKIPVHLDRYFAKKRQVENIERDSLQHSYKYLE
jgi:hypothetical protein